MNPKVQLLIQLSEVLRLIINDSMTIETTTSKGKVVGLQQPDFRSIGGLTKSARWWVMAHHPFDVLWPISYPLSGRLHYMTMQGLSFDFSWKGRNSTRRIERRKRNCQREWLAIPPAKRINPPPSTSSTSTHLSQQVFGNNRKLRKLLPEWSSNIHLIIPIPPGM